MHGDDDQDAFNYLGAENVGQGRGRRRRRHRRCRGLTNSLPRPFLLNNYVSRPPSPKAIIIIMILMTWFFFFNVNARRRVIELLYLQTITTERGRVVDVHFIHLSITISYARRAYVRHIVASLRSGNLGSFRWLYLGAVKL